MADKYGAYYNTGTYDAFKAAIRYEVTEKTNTTYTIRCRSWIKMGDGHDNGSSFAGRAYVTDEYSDWVYGTGYYKAGSESGWLGDITKTITRTHSDQTITCSGQAWSRTWGGSDGVYSPWVNATVTVPAKPSYTVTYNANGGSGAPQASTKWYGESLALSSTQPTKSGYTFLGWATSSTATPAKYSAGSSYTSNAAATLYAVWRKSITLTYNANGGSGAPSQQTGYAYNSATSYEFTVSSTSPTRANYAFLGWSTSSSATSATYAAGAKVTLSSATTLYAVWKLAAVAPTLSSLKAYRSTSAGEADASSTTYVTFEIKWSVDANSTASTRQVVYSYKVGTGSTTTKTATLSGTSGTSTKHTYAVTIGNDKTLSVTATVSATTGSTTLSASRSAVVPVVAYPMTWNNGGMSIGVFGMADRTRNKVLQVFGDLDVTGSYGLTADDIPSLAASKIGSGTFDAGRIPNLAASKINSGTIALARGGTASDNSSRAPHTIFAGPSSGTANGNASWRALVTSDLPTVSFTSLGTTSGTTTLSINCSGYAWILVRAYYSTTYWSTIIVPTGQLDASTYRDFYLGGGWWSSGYGASFKAIKTKFTPYRGMVGSTERDMNWAIWGIK